MDQISSLNSNFLFPSKDRWLQYFSEFGYFPITFATLRNVKINASSIYYGRLSDLAEW